MYPWAVDTPASGHPCWCRGVGWARLSDYVVRGDQRHGAILSLTGSPQVPQRHLMNSGLSLCPELWPFHLQGAGMEAPPRTGNPAGTH